ncbi:hypothetical protein [Limnohabitans sp.]|uniref:hypothetical protein n=1 Tax=Limnohabitans sp. TaxID=1907725 RepID=UPI00286F450B|nr:hypothetical protein [Limnohabitans sp.]
MSDGFDSVVEVLPPEMQTLVRIAIDTNATVEIQAEAAKSIVEGTPLPLLKKFVLRFIQNKYLEGNLNA